MSSSSHLRSTGGKDKAAAVRPGSNWKALKKNIASQSASAAGSDVKQPAKKKLKTAHRQNGHAVGSSSHASSHSKDKAGERDQHGRNYSAGGSIGSPAPTSLPWFAEDLSPEDLALVRHIQEGGDATLNGAGIRSSSSHPLLGDLSGKDVKEKGKAVEPAVGGAALVAVSKKEAVLKKRVILGGWDENVSEEKKAPGNYLAIDCEMVGVGPKGSESMLARVSIVNWHGYTILDTFVKPMEKVTDYRTWVSGIRPKDLAKAPPFAKVQAQVAELIKDKTIIGHAIQNDLKALLLTHPRYLIRDTSTFQPLRELAKTSRPSLRTLTKLALGIDIQLDGEEHSSVEDARATMAVFRTQKTVWDAMLKKGGALNPNGRGVEDSEAQPNGTTPPHGKKRKHNGISSNGDAPRKSKSRTPSQPDWWKS